MKIKTWLLTSYMIMMVLPLISAYFLFVSITNYYDERKVEEYYDVQAQLDEVNRILRDPSLYTGKINREKLGKELKEGIQVKLYRSDGLLLYTSEKETFIMPNTALLYRDLYEMDESLHLFSYKEPVFDGQELVGVYEVQIYRDQLMQRTKSQLIVTISLLIGSFLLLYAGMAYIVHRKVNGRLYHLMDEMSAFAEGHEHPEMKRSKDEIGQLQAHFYTMKEDLTKAQAAIKEEQRKKEYMIAAISHDLKTPLTSIKAYAEALEQYEGDNGELRHEYEQVLVEKSNFMQQMLDDLMTYTLLQSNDIPVRKVLVDGGEFIDMLFSDYETVCEQKGVYLYVSNHVQAPIKVSVKEMTRVIDNLMTNAIRYTKSGENIYLLAFEHQEQVEEYVFPFVVEEKEFTDDFVYILVQNEGQGIAKEELPYLFDPLYQVDRARNKKETIGTGLGLSIAKKLIEMHGGTISVHTKENIGVCFICTLPKMGEDER